MADIRQTPISQLPALTEAVSSSSPVVVVQGGVTYRTTAGALIALAGGAYTDEMAQDAFAAMIAAGTLSGITATYDDAGNAIGFTVTATGGGARTRGTATQAGGTLTIDMAGRPSRDFAASAPTANITAVTITNPPAAGSEFRFSIRIPNVGSYTFTKPGNWSPVGQSDTAFTASKAHLIEAVSYDDGATFLFAMQEIP